MFNRGEVKNGDERRYTSSASPTAFEIARPMSIAMGPTLIWLNAIGDIEAQAITEAWRTRFNIRTASQKEMEAMEW